MDAPWCLCLWLTSDSPSLTGSCRPQPRFYSSPGRCESGSPCLWLLRGSSWSCSGSRAVPSAPSALWRCDLGCWRGYSLTSPDAPVSSALWMFACGGSWCTHCAPFSAPPSWRGPEGKMFRLVPVSLVCFKYHMVNLNAFFLMSSPLTSVTETFKIKACFKFIYRGIYCTCLWLL